MSTAPNATSPPTRLLKDALLALAFLAVAAGLPVLAPDHPQLPARALGVMSGAVVVFYANAVPKALTPLAKLKDPAKADATRRFAAWALVLGGLGHALAWALAPWDYAAPVSVVVLGGAVLTAIGRCFRLRRAA